MCNEYERVAKRELERSQKALRLKMKKLEEKENKMGHKFNVGDTIVPSDFYVEEMMEDMKREILEVGDTFYVLKFLTGAQLVVKWPIHGVDGDHRIVK